MDSDDQKLPRNGHTAYNAYNAMAIHGLGQSEIIDFDSAYLFNVADGTVLILYE